MSKINKFLLILIMLASIFIIIKPMIFFTFALFKFIFNILIILFAIYLIVLVCQKILVYFANRLS